MNKPSDKKDYKNDCNLNILQCFSPVGTFLLRLLRNETSAINNGQHNYPTAQSRKTSDVSSDAPTNVVSKNVIRTRVTKDDLFIVQMVGKGTWGTVLACSLRFRESSQSENQLQLNGLCIDNLYAVKIMKKEDLIKEKMIKSAIIERQILRELDHPFLVKLHFAFEDESKLFMGMDYVPGGDLYAHLRRYGKFKPEQVKFYTMELALAVQYIHSLGVVYRDLKPENIIIDADGHIKLVDFGLAKIGVTDPFKGATSMCGTSYYLAPEVLCRVEYGYCVDWWGLGVIIYELLTGSPPWYAKDQSQKNLFFKIKKSALPLPVHWSKSCASLIRGLLEKNPRRRLGSKNASEVLNHAFFHGCSKLDIESGKVQPPIIPCSNYGSLTAAKFSKKHKPFHWDWSDMFKSSPLKDPKANNHSLESFDFNYCHPDVSHAEKNDT